MLFNSGHFLIFFPIVVIIYFLLPLKARKLFLLAASWYFYAAWKPEFLLLLIFTSLVDFLAAIKIENCKEKNRKIWLFVSLFMNLAVLFGFKYLNFFDRTLYRIFSDYRLFSEIPLQAIVLPMGISFYTFQTMSYTIDVYKKRLKAERDFFKFSLFISFFPHLVAGPIVRAPILLPQFDKKYTFDYKRITDGMKLMFWGFFQKVVIADNMSRFVKEVFSNPGTYHGFDVILVTVFFAIQIFCDFSGYSDIARGAAKIMGYNLTINFLRPYFAKSFSDFWQRWHITLSTWYRDYLYIELGGNRTTTMRWIFNILITFLLSGLWHGASLNFVIWGILHGIFYVTESLMRKKFGSLSKMVEHNIIIRTIRSLFMFSLICFAWIFFRSQSVQIAFTLIENSLHIFPIVLSFDHKAIFVNCLLIAFLFVIQVMERKKDIVEIISGKSLYFRWSVYFTMIALFLILGNFKTQEFIYFQF